MEKEIIIYFLQHSELETELWNQARDIRKQMIELQEEQDKLRNDIIYANQVGISISSEPTARTNNTTDISDVINRTERELAGYRRDLISAYTEILKKIETIIYLFLSFILFNNFSKTIDIKDTCIPDTANK